MVELTKVEERQLLENSIERVINTSMKLVHAESEDADIDLTYWEELKDINLTDWEELKPLVVKLWNSARNEVFKKRNGIK